ncbi:nose resistant to fluoxetine protein 6-like [Plakobranchus ocellatus]|uniref:Nose resistant to fluoxetine protein 6-like n=1 Tax=Plakobranchus ocellatus TaxID=259542 RepID=A0AAV4D6X5_9GAST|nr:nose resistant to fluoxetine protein 6-like [Plakobranchus ocellatus]
MCWIVLGHTLLVALVDTDNILEFIFVYRQKVLFMILANGFLCVDTFFVISGIMVGYVFQQIVENETRMKYIVYVLHRFIRSVWVSDSFTRSPRLSPALIVFGAIYICLWPQLGSGPNYPSKAPDEDMCRETWYYTVFYINNFLPMDKLEQKTKSIKILFSGCWASVNRSESEICKHLPICEGPSPQSPGLRPSEVAKAHYQIKSGYRKIGVFLALSFAAGTIITSGVISYENNMAEIVPQFITDGGKIADPREYYNYFYQRPYCRMGPYIVGLLLGYTFQVTERKIKLSRPVVVIGWILSTVTALAVLFSPYSSFSQHRIWYNWECALYNAFKHTAFGMSVAWVVLACVTGYGGVVNVFLSWKAFVPFSRITYCTYLVHPAVLYLFHYSLKGVLWLNMWAVIVHFLGVLFISIVLGFFLSLLVESPAIQLERAVLRSLGYY